jgi:oligopeptide transport system substrate-binding protein
MVSFASWLLHHASRCLKRPGTLAGLGLVLVLCGCARRETDVQRATRENMLLVNNATEPADLDINLSTGAPEARLHEALFEGLTRLDPGTLEVEPGVAERWDISEDQLVYTFHLRANARWSDGHPVTAHDFLATVRRLLTPALASDRVQEMYYLAGAEDFYHGRIQDFDQVGVKVIDDRTIQYRLRYPKPFFLKSVARPTWCPIPRHVIERLNGMARRDSGWTRPENFVSNGPFVLKEWRPRQFLSVERSPTYWNRDTVRLSAVRYYPIESQTADELAFRAGQLHKTHVLPANKVEVWRREDPALLRSVPRSGTYFYAFNVTKPPFNDVRVRRALALTVDRELLTKHILGTGELPAYHFIVDGTGGSYVSKTNLPYDPPAARRLLAEAGFPEGRGFPQVAVLYNTTERHRTIAEAVQQMWRKELGIDISLRNEEWGVYLQSMDTKNFDIVRTGLLLEPYDPWMFLETYTTGFGFNRTGWSNAEYDRLVEALEAAADPVERESLAQQAEALLMQEVPIVPFHFYRENYLVHRDVQNWEDSLLEISAVGQAWLAH